MIWIMKISNSDHHLERIPTWLQHYLMPWCSPKHSTNISKYLVAQMVKNLPTMQETWLWHLIGKIPWRKEWQPTPVFLPGESHGQKSLVGYSSWSCKELDTTEGLSTSKKDILSATVFILFNFPTQVTCCAKVCVFPLCGKVMIH